ncbi:MAG: P1 family peptidase [Acidimicrobiia bacterium]|nr:P1 family peptidase [Acidimicrobiia bacterium]
MSNGLDAVCVGHWSDHEALTGCTVVLPPPGTVASGEVRGGAPATREFALLEPTKFVTCVDAVVLSGGSAFGLAAGDGVMAHLEAAGRGVPTIGGAVPIVVGMSLFDLAVGDPTVRPGAAEGRHAAEEATPFFADGVSEEGVARVGAGTGATFGEWRGEAARQPAGLGWARVRYQSVSVAAWIAVNAYGGAARPDDPVMPDGARFVGGLDESLENTTIGVVATDAALDKVGCHLMAQAGHDGLARALRPAHAMVDGDALVALATGAVSGVSLDLVRHLSAAAVERAIRAATGVN